MPQALHPLQPVIRRIAKAAYDAEAHGAPCDLMLLDALTQDLRARTVDKSRLSTRHHISSDMPPENQGAQCQVPISMPSPKPPQAMGHVAPQPSHLGATWGPAETLYALMGRADWRDRPYHKRLADAVVACAFGRSVDAVSRQYDVAPDVIGGGLVILHTEGPQGVMQYLGGDTKGRT